VCAPTLGSVNRAHTPPKPYALFGVGIVGGVMAGFFGVGGGVIMVPLLLWWARMNQREAQASSLLAIAPAALVGTASYSLGGVFPLLPALVLAGGAVAGAQLGAYLLRRLSLGWLRWTFTGFVATMSITVMLTVPHREAQVQLGIAESVALLAIGIGMGTASGLFGIGGGIIAIPLIMLSFGVGDLEAKGMSLIAMAPAAISGSLAHLHNRTARLRNGAWIAGGALVATPFGAAGAFGLPESVANVVFGVFALTISVFLAIRGMRSPRNLS
jgi:uncharacterized membrane protein YfcA